MYYGFTAIRDIYFSVNLFNFFTFHRGINVFSAEISFPPRKKVFTPRRKLSSVEILFFAAEKSLYSKEKTLMGHRTVRLTTSISAVIADFFLIFFYCRGCLIRLGRLWQLRRDTTSRTLAGHITVQ